MLLEHDRLDVGQINHVIDDAEFRLGIFWRNFLQRGLPGEAHGHDRRETVLGEFAQDLLALRLVLDLKIAEIDAGLLLELCRAVEHTFVERFVELAAKIIKNGGLNRVGRIGRYGGKKTSGKSRRRHERGAAQHIQTSVGRELLPSPRPKKLTGWSSRSARNLTRQARPSRPQRRTESRLCGQITESKRKPASGGGLLGPEPVHRKKAAPRGRSPFPVE